MQVWHSGLAFDRSNLRIIFIYHCGSVYLKIYKFYIESTTSLFFTETYSLTNY